MTLPTTRRRARQRLRFFERLEDRRVMAASLQVGDIGYIVDDQAARLLRYDIANEIWLDPITLAEAPGVPNVVMVDDDGIYAAYGTAVERYSLDGATHTHLLDTSQQVQAIHSDGKLLIVNSSYTNGDYAHLVSLDKQTNQVLDTTEREFDTVWRSTLDAATNTIYGHNNNDDTFRPIMASVRYDDQGNFVSSAHGTWIDETRSMHGIGLLPGGKLIYEDSTGGVYDIETLQFVDSLNLGVGDIAFAHGTDPIVLNGKTLQTYSADLLPLRTYDLGYSPGFIFVNDTNLITLRRVASVSPTEFNVHRIPLSELAPPEPGPPLDPNGLAYMPHSVDVGPDGVVHITARFSKSIFSFDPVEQVYGATVPLRDIPKATVFSPQANVEYLLYRSGLVTRVDFNAEQPREELFTKIIGPIETQTISIAGPYLVATAYGQPHYFNTSSSYTVAPDGTVVDTLGSFLTGSAWSDPQQKLYLADGYALRSLEVNANGTAYPDIPAGSFGDWQTGDDDRFNRGPVYLSDDGSLILLGSRGIFDGPSMQWQSDLPNAFTDAAWLDDELYTTRTLSSGAQVQHWMADSYQLDDDVALLPGTAIALERIGRDRMLAVSREGSGVPHLHVLNGDLQVVPANRAPVLDTSLNPTLVSVREDAVSPGSTLVSDLIKGAVSDPDPGALRGIAVTAASGFNGTWEYSLSGGRSWLPMGSPSESAARLLPGWARIKFTPKPDFDGVVKMYYHAWDQTRGTPGETFDLRGNTGGAKAFSISKESASLTVTPVNDPPVLSFSESIGYVHDTPPITLAAYARVIDDSADFGGGLLRVRITDGADASNRLSLGPGFTVDADNNVWQGTTLVGKRYSNGYATNELRIRFADSLAQSMVQDLVRSITFKTVGGAAGTRRVLFSLSDGAGGTSEEVAKVVNVT